MPGFGERWFAMFPDTPASSPLAERLGSWAVDHIAHSSGRPWLVGRWPEGWVSIDEAGPVRIVDVGPQAVRRLASRIDHPSDLDGAAVRGHLVGSVRGTLRLQATPAATTLVYYASPDGMTVAASRADVLAYLLDADYDTERLATHLMGQATILAGLAPPWRGVEVVPPDSGLEISPTGARRVVGVWTAPEPGRSVRQEAGELAAALDRSVRAHINDASAVSADLSGGLDSTPLCFLAQRAGASVTAVTTRSRDPFNDDFDWAERATDHLPGCEWLVLSGDDLAYQYDRVLESGIGLDRPPKEIRSFADFLGRSSAMAARGALVHMSGAGGDALFRAPWSYLPELARRRPREAMRHLRGWRAQWQWSMPTALRRLGERTTYRQWMRRQAGMLTASDQNSDDYSADLWGFPARMPPWSTGDAIDAARRSVTAAAEREEPLAANPAQHRTIAALWDIGADARTIDQAMARHTGLRWIHPLMDPDVMHAALRVSLAERGDPRRYKPLLKAALDGVVPDLLLTRTTKGHFDIDIHLGLRRNRAALMALCEDPLLARHGLVDPDRIRNEVLTTENPSAALESTLACEAWLRGRQLTQPEKDDDHAVTRRRIDGPR